MLEKIEVWANTYPSDLSELEKRGIEVRTSDSPNWKAFIFPEGWTFKHSEKGVEEIYDADGKFFGKYIINYQIDGIKKSIRITRYIN